MGMRVRGATASGDAAVGRFSAMATVLGGSKHTLPITCRNQCVILQICTSIALMHATCVRVLLQPRGSPLLSRGKAPLQAHRVYMGRVAAVERVLKSVI